MRFRASIDGAARGNPGPAAYGVVIRDGRGDIVAKQKKYIGRMTNNVAEYYGLIAAMDYAQSHGIRALRVESAACLYLCRARFVLSDASLFLRGLGLRRRRVSFACRVGHGPGLPADVLEQLGEDTA